MIFVEKSRETPDISVYKHKRSTGPDGTKMPLAQKEFLEAIAFFTNPANYKDEERIGSDSFKFKVYKKDVVKKLLIEIFNGKCAYCETSILAAQSGDIEHFRPKAEIHTDDGRVLKPGYYWLGASWENLLLSCIKCNRPNKENFINQEDLILTGKANLFPLIDETKRLRKHTDDIRKEDAFVNLLNPCLDKPENHITFLPNGQVKALDSKGERSIAVYGLFRANLTRERAKVALNLKGILQLLTNILQKMQKAIEQSIPIETIDEENLEVLAGMMEFAFTPESAYLGIKRSVLKEFMDTNPQTSILLTSLGIPIESYLKGS